MKEFIVYKEAKEKEIKNIAQVRVWKMGSGAGQR